MPDKSLITQQNISPLLKARAKEMRKQMTPAEHKLWQSLRANRLEGFHFRRQQIIAPYIVDFYCHAVGLVVEVDGEVHLEQEAYDKDRDAYLQASGLKVLRFNNREVWNQLDLVLGEILRECRLLKHKAHSF
jgi:very-short-patch-repair endonuclease